MVPMLRLGFPSLSCKAGFSVPGRSKTNIIKHDYSIFTHTLDNIDNAHILMVVLYYLFPLFNMDTYSHIYIRS